ncbi:glyoxalase [Azoarcus sp. DD4]|uniref:VOC family protein n=1 Tax=Azoarcus sp. DD4 TaxID=2027405 RepID=UPI00112618A1|nr:VOC family protein [Azoarcus sp. DD4]QDF98119.1 glyoxalase [Azoarcus sp. DD4]
MAVQPVPEAYRRVTPYLCVDGAAAAIDFYKRAFAAEELFRLAMPDGRVGHAELRIGDTPVMLADACEEGPSRNPRALGGTSVGLHLYVEDVDAVFQRTVEAGARVIRPLQDQFYGDRTGTVEDPYGHVWFLASHREDLLPAEIEKRAAALMSGGKA